MSTYQRCNVRWQCLPDSVAFDPRQRQSYLSRRVRSHGTVSHLLPRHAFDGAGEPGTRVHQSSATSNRANRLMHHTANTFLAMFGQFFIYEHCTVGRIDTIAQMLEDFAVQIRIAFLLGVFFRGQFLPYLLSCLLIESVSAETIVIRLMTKTISPTSPTVIQLKRIQSGC